MIGLMNGQDPQPENFTTADFYEWFNEKVASQNVVLSEKEHFVLAAQTQILQAV